MSDVRPGSKEAFILASRPATLSAALVPVAVGTAAAFVPFHYLDLGRRIRAADWSS